MKLLMFHNDTDNQTPYIDSYDIHQNLLNSTEYNNITWFYYPPSWKKLLLIREYVTPVLFSIGIFFNVFTCIILRGTECKKVTPFVYMFALCIVDSVYLIAKLIPNQLYNIYIIPGVCQIVYYLSFLSIFMEWWIIVMLLSERCIALYSSRVSSKYCSAFRVKCALITMSLLAIVAHLYHTWTSIVHDDGIVKKCIIIPEFYQYLTLLRKLDVIFAFLLPFSLILIMLAVLMIQLCKRKRRSKTEIRQFVSTSTTVAKRPVTLCVEDRGFGRRIPDGLALRIIVSKRSVTVKLLIVVVLKLILCVPHDILKAKMTMFDTYFASETERTVLLFLDEVYSLNFTIKGLLCFILFPSFRNLTGHYLLKKLRSCCQSIFTCIRDHNDL